jgi:hypothetical protein
MRYAFALLLLLVFLAGCQKGKALSPSEYVSWVRDPENGLVAQKTIAGYSFSLHYTPAEYSALLEAPDKTKIAEGAVAQIKKEREAMQYYMLRIQSEKARDILTSEDAPNELSSRLEYFTGMAQDDIVLVEGADTLSSSLYHFERSYGLDKGNAIVLGFSKTAQFMNQDKELIYADRVLGTGPIHLTISHAAIQQIPPIRYEN